MWGVVFPRCGDTAKQEQGVKTLLKSDEILFLDQAPFDCPFDRRPEIRSVEFAEDAFGVRAKGAQGNLEFMGDLGS